jgi:hypothetical protein
VNTNSKEKRRNYVAKYLKRFNKSCVFIDKKRQAKKTGLYSKSDTHYRDGDNT